MAAEAVMQDDVVAAATKETHESVVSSDTSDLSLDPAVSVCRVCFEVSASPPLWTCASQITICGDCFIMYLKTNVTENMQRPLYCPCGCEQQLLRADLEDRGIDHALVELYDRNLSLLSNPNLFPCPTCNALVHVNKSSRPNAHCPQCNIDFCCIHGLDHVDRPCEGQGVSAQAWLANKWFLLRHTRSCPKCHHAIEKNGGCNHMTCRCGFEICWRCGGPYTKYGRRGHGEALFPSLAEFKYQCNDYKMWTKRFGVVTLGVPVMLTAAVVGLPLYVGYRMTGGIRRRIARVVAEVRRRREMARYLHQMADTHCFNYRDYLGITTPCLTCTGHTTCAHAVVDERGICVSCSHFTPAAMDCIAHYYSSSNPDRCTFCNRPREVTEVAATSIQTATAALAVNSNPLPRPASTTQDMALAESNISHTTLSAARNSLLQAKAELDARIDTYTRRRSVTVATDELSIASSMSTISLTSTSDDVSQADQSAQDAESDPQGAKNHVNILRAVHRQLLAEIERRYQREEPMD